MLTGTFTPEIGRMTRLTAMVYIITLMVPSTRVNGLRTSRMVVARKLGQTMLAMKVTTRKVRNTALVYSTGLTGLHTTVLLKIITSRDQVFMNGLTVVSMMELGSITRWMDRACSHGKTTAAMRVNMLTTKKKDTESLPGLTVVSTKVPGAMVSRMAKVFTLLKMVQRKEEFGRRANVRPG
jgi:hypothetical protein